MKRRKRSRWPLVKVPGSEKVPFYNRLFQRSTRPGMDPMLTWGTEVDVSRVPAFLQDASQRWNIPLSMPVVLIKATGMALAAHPELLCRVVRRRLYRYKRISATLAFHNQHRDEADLHFLYDIDKFSCAHIFNILMRDSMRVARGEDPRDPDKRFLERSGPLMGPIFRSARFLYNNFHLPDMIGRLGRLQTAVVAINYLAFAGAPSLRSFKAAQLGSNCGPVHVTLGPTEPRPVVEEGQVVVRPVAPLIVRIDHRVADAVVLGRFVATLQTYLSDPACIPGLEDDVTPDYS